MRSRNSWMSLVVAILTVAIFPFQLKADFAPLLVTVKNPANTSLIDAAVEVAIPFGRGEILNANNIKITEVASSNPYASQ